MSMNYNHDTEICNPCLKIWNTSPSDPLTRPGCVAPWSCAVEGGVRWVPVPCGSSSRGCVRGCWPDPEGQRRRWALFISLSIFNNLPELSEIMKDMYTISKPSISQTQYVTYLHLKQIVDGHLDTTVPF